MDCVFFLNRHVQEWSGIWIGLRRDFLKQHAACDSAHVMSHKMLPKTTFREQVETSQTVLENEVLGAMFPFPGTIGSFQEHCPQFPEQLDLFRDKFSCFYSPIFLRNSRTCSPNFGEHVTHILGNMLPYFFAFLYSDRENSMCRNRSIYDWKFLQ